MGTIKTRLKEIETEIEALKKERRGIYRASLDAPDDEKVCSDHVAEGASEPPLFPRLRHPYDVYGINWVNGGEWVPDGSLVCVRPCAGKGKGKTFAGILIGRLPQGISCSYRRKDGILSIKPGFENPLIYIPDLQRLVWGSGSWWGLIYSEDQLREEITDQDIQDTWYVKALRAMAEPSKGGDA